MNVRRCLCNSDLLEICNQVFLIGMLATLVCHCSLLLLQFHLRILVPHAAQSQLAELLAPLLRQCVSLFAQLLILQDRELVFDLVDFRLRGVGRERGLDRVDGGGLAVGGETSGGPFRTDL
jgi:hypothetical protein